MMAHDEDNQRIINLVYKITDVAIYLGESKPIWKFLGYPFVFERGGLNVQGLYKYRSASGMAHIFNKGKVECDGELVVEGVFVEIGYLAKTDFINKLVKVNDKKEIVADINSSTDTKGIFACGDVTNCNYKQVVISAGEGAKAALQAYKFLKLKEGQKISPDWKVKKN